MKTPPRPRRRNALLVASTTLGRYAACAAVSMQDLDLVEVCVRGGLEQGLHRRRVDRIVIELTSKRPALLPEVLGARARAGRPDVPIVLFGVEEADDGLEIPAAIESLTGLTPWDAESVLQVWVADLGTLATVLAAAGRSRHAGRDTDACRDSHHSFGTAEIDARHPRDTLVEVA